MLTVCALALVLLAAVVRNRPVASSKTANLKMKLCRTTGAVKNRRFGWERFSLYSLAAVTRKPIQVDRPNLNPTYQGVFLIGFIQDFKEFAFKGNLIDMAVGIVMGTAVAGVVKSFLDNIITPLIAVVAGVPDLSSMKYPVGGEIEVKNAAGEMVMEQAALKYGTFIAGVIDFAILAFVIFIALKVASSFMKTAEDPEPSDEVKLLTEIRDSLANR